jgi:hypothetical protein
MRKQVNNWVYTVDSEWPRECGFCGMALRDWEGRAIYLERHFRKGSTIADWMIPLPILRDKQRSRFRGFYKEDDNYEDDNIEVDEEGAPRDKFLIYSRV